MTEAEWLDEDDGRQLLQIEQHATLRKLRLMAAALVLHLQLSPEHDEAKRCDDLIEAGADCPRPWADVELALHDRPGNWRFTHMLARGERVAAAKELRKLFAFYGGWSGFTVRELLHEIVGNPFRPITFDPAWRSDTAVSLAREIYDRRDFSAMPILADALQDAGCENEDVLNHCRDEVAVHVRGCWVVDLVLGKE